METKNVHPPEFFKVYFPHINSKFLPLPLAFNRYLAQPLPKTAILRNSSGNRWRVDLTRRQEFACFECGWPKFAEDNDLKAGEFMVFVYEAPRTFLVNIYGHSSCREKRAQVVIHEISEEKEEDVMDIGDFSDSSYSLQSEDETSDEEVLSETPTVTKSRKLQACVKKGKSKGRWLQGQGSSGGQEIIYVENPERYLDDPANPFFVTNKKNRNFELLVPAQTIKDYSLKFSETISFIDPCGSLTGRFANWSDQRICFKGWNSVCRRNKLKPEDKVICELKHTENLVHSIRVHIIRDKPEAV